MTSNVLIHDGVRYELGRRGDVALLGDWDCDGKATPAAWRPSTREVFYFAGWANPGEPLPAARRVHATRPPTVSCP